jgi:hypothetical protein
VTRRRAMEYRVCDACVVAPSFGVRGTSRLTAREFTLPGFGKLLDQVYRFLQPHAERIHSKQEAIGSQLKAVRDLLLSHVVKRSGGGWEGVVPNNGTLSRALVRLEG